ncbi:unnamed protein product [Calicophoron daubneyi]|uniref:SRCR domain-containing protein n=1 Tax=Calicophoron daubneyi TaxID=300641 RepID=A0AAV2T8I0_CALDB
MTADWLLLTLVLLLTRYGGILSVVIDTTVHQDGDVKLVDGPAPTMGTVMVYRNYGWGPICDDHWTMQEAQVVCRQLGMGHALEAHRRNRYGSTMSSDYLMDEVHCTGKEKKLTDCRFPGWGVHDCKRNEQVGVKCSYEPPVSERSKWNPLKLKLDKPELDKMAAVPISLVRPDRNLEGTNTLDKGSKLAGFYPVLIELKDGTRGGVCPDHFHGSEAIVFCHQIGVGNGGRVIPMPPHHTGLSTNKSIAIIGYCYGNESKLSDCKTYTNPDGVPCSTWEVAAVECVTDLPDIIPDKQSLESSVYLQKMSLWLLECALEENCLPEQVYRLIDNNPTTYTWMTRTLMRFSSIVGNIGKIAFRPFLEPEKWEWHACHMHYHSMKVFSRYEVVDPQERLMTTGMKASFCLEDNICAPGAVKKFHCSNVLDSKGTQGISPGCQDTYLHDFDCQWVDLTDVAPGSYSFQVSFNPDGLVPESDYFNNALVCKLTYMGNSAIVRDCKLTHPNDLVF